MLTITITALSQSLIDTVIIIVTHLISCVM